MPNAREGYHINIDSVVLELTDVKSTGRGRYSGKTVATCLYRFATPIIRYQIGDIVEVVDSECSCGRGLPLMSRIYGRVVDCVLTRDGGLLSPYVVLNVVQSVEGIRKFRIIQRQDYTVEVVASVNPGRVEQVVEELERRLPDALQGLPYKVQIVDDFPDLPGSKAKLVESQVPR